MTRYNAHRATMRTIENIHNTPEHTMSINIGMSEAQRKTIAEGLAKVLADSYTLYLKTHNYHWNVEGQETVVRTCRVLLPAVDEASDEPTNDLLTNRMQTHEKAAWMLRALLEK